MSNIELIRIDIENFKSINKKISINIKKYNNSYTKVLIGLNEAGKSNILEAIYLFNKKENSEYNFSLNRNRNNNTENISVDFFMNISNLTFCIKDFLENIPEELLKKINNLSITKQIWITKENKIKNYYEINGYELLKDVNLGQYLISDTKHNIIKKVDINNDSEFINCAELDKEKLKECIEQNLNDIEIIDFSKYEPLVSIWKSEEKYLISKPINLIDFVVDPDNISPSLKNIFYLCGYNTNEKIKNKINEVLDPNNFSIKDSFLKDLSKNITKYINDIWKEHDIKISFSIDTPNLNVTITDSKDVGGCYKMTERSQGFKQFISLILSLSIKNDYDNFSNNIVLIDEPETHLHPSGIRYMQKELLKIGKNNYIFIATHSFFMVDNKTPERHLLITNKYETKIKDINNKNVYDEEVIREAFGLYFYKDLMVTNKILVEGASDKIILDKVLKKELKDTCNFRITNGCGSNIVQICSLFENMQIDNLLVIVDDDTDGRKYKDNIIKIGENYSKSNVFTIRDLCGDVIDKGTIEDLLPIEFLKSITTKTFNNILNENDIKLINKDQPFIEQLKIILKKQNKNDNDFIKEKIDELKLKISNEYVYTENKAPKLKKIADNIIRKLKNENNIGEKQ